MSSERKISYQNFYYWYQKVNNKEFLPNIPYKVCLESGAFFAVAFFDHLELKELNNSVIYYKDIVIFKAGSPSILKPKHHEVLYDGLVFKELTEADIPRLYNTVKFINRSIVTDNYSGKYYSEVANRVLDKYEELRQRCLVDNTLNLFGIETNKAKL